MCRDEAFRVLILACSKASRIFCYPSLLLGSMVNIHHILQYLCQEPRLTMKAEERFLCVKREIRFLVW